MVSSNDLHPLAPFGAAPNARPRSFAFWLANVLLLRWPEKYLRLLENLRLDPRIQQRGWENLMSTLRQDWDRCASPTIILLIASANVLVLRMVARDTAARSEVMLTTGTSILLSLAALFIQEIMLRQLRGKISNTMNTFEAARFLQLEVDHKLRLEGLALSMSFPQAFTRWSMFFFAVTVCRLAFRELGSMIHSTPRVAFAIPSFVVLVVFLARRYKVQATSVRQHVEEP
ncbi:hypothetical protein EIP91_001230 [Steccherinum ochraceum]|uniref:Uncharacterized protein n=1 Tax=Steccherinum ochraceum TaxID=92696 RepID=A0A4R0RHF2_9APHY|nr:hypothetical protein EIP91_001230 [Steccherinum ochraceum]